MTDKSIEEQIAADREAWGGKPEPELHGQKYLDKYVNGEHPGPSLRPGEAEIAASKCPECKGAKWVGHEGGFGADCPTCHGTGVGQKPEPGPEEESQLAQGVGGHLEEAKPAESKDTGLLGDLAQSIANKTGKVVEVQPAGIVAKPELPPGGLAEAARNAGAEVNQVEFTGVPLGEGVVATSNQPEPEEAEVTPFSGTTAVISIAPGEDPKVMALLTEASELVNYARAREINSVEAAKKATDDLVIMKKLKERIALKQKEWTAPISEKLDRVKSAFKLILGPLELANQITRDKVMEYRKAEQEKAAAAEKAAALQEEAALLEAKARGDDKPEATPAAVVVPAQPEHYRANLGMAGFAKKKKWKITDFAKLPDQYKLPDAGKIRKIVEAGGEIDGVETWMEEELRVTG